MGKKSTGAVSSSPTADRLLLDQRIRRAITELTVPHRQKDAYWTLRLLGEAARPAVEEGLFSDDADLRVQCTLLIDRLAGNESFELVMLLLDDPDPRVRRHAIHALACDRCKADDVCALPHDELVAAATNLVTSDADPHVRAIALEVLARWVHDDDEARVAIEHAAVHDPSPAVRKKAAWYLPGGRIHERTTRRPRRAARQ
ncbi:MAG TPA: HEAT repeat domain-containing protein [Acidimicrobiales bacterium]|nr:HEAT repeat domain-containing protein [Acidimicrobiales bacterium]